MRSLYLQYFLLFGSMASVQPYVALLLKDRGLNTEQIGYAMGVSGWAVMLSPAVITLLADTRMEPRRLVSVLSVAAALALGALLWSGEVWLLTLFYFLYSLAVTAMLPLQDGIVFGFRKLQEEAGVAPALYSKVRVWGTYGYIGLLIALFAPLRWYGNVALAFVFAIVCFGGLIVNSFALPQRGRRETARRAQRLPTTDALRALLSGRAIAFSLGMFLLLSASAAYHTMYPVFLAEDLGIPKHWIGIVIVLGTLGEVFYIHALSGWEKRWGLRAVMLAGVAATVVRFGAMYAFPVALVAIGCQALHGAMICSMMVIPPSYLDGLANETNRNSIQGVYTMVVVGASRFVGTALSGDVAAISQRDVYLLAFGLSAAALGLLWFGFRGNAGD